MRAAVCLMHLPPSTSHTQRGVLCRCKGALVYWPSWSACCGRCVLSSTRPGFLSCPRSLYIHVRGFLMSRVPCLYRAAEITPLRGMVSPPSFDLECPRDCAPVYFQQKGLMLMKYEIVKFRVYNNNNI